MLDLKSLKQKLDNSLEKETNRTLKKWLLKKRIKQQYANKVKSKLFLKTYKGKSFLEIMEMD